MLPIIYHNLLSKRLIAILIATCLTTVHADSIVDTSSIVLTDENNKQVTINSYNGYLKLVFFGYSHCPDVCPLTLFYIASALKSLENDANKIKVLFISVDPKRDTPEVLSKYTDAFHKSIIGLSGSYDQIMTATSNFRTTFGYNLNEKGKEKTLSKAEYEEIPTTMNYVPYHSSQLYILDVEGELVDIIGYGSKHEFIAKKLKQYLELVK